ncbi:DUF1398 domain-containing protein [Aureimonas fodinaquatilis]|uniref:DUF1398 domain-containing protein n=1 Tax=Aureimonas fodinaquatilis TaxID=2565783 RepID=A0A5B0E319_9HYPH|nr:DUF1398 family protein [Aureimonas fodinaquatilis]KAA0972361.1 DUF1398 domain-containing protein [Aureimonas fodinaquatilis]
MDAERTSIAQNCLNAAYNGSMSFPQIVGRLMDAGFESYMVDYRRNTQSFYLADGDSVTLSKPDEAGSVAAAFDEAGIAAQVKWAQANGPDYSYRAFCENVKAAGCAGYIVSFSGRRAVYFGRTAQTHVEHFPQ